ncbi:MAG: HAD family phosphatase [Oscillospiraceae bacterium]|nr:HAD family phosphatase [Oscillospiraceae bacterium]
MKLHIFDLDGTLADSNPVWDTADRGLVRKYSLDLTEEEISSLAAMVYEDLYDFLVKKGLPDVGLSRIKDELDDIALYEYEHNVPLKKGAKEYLAKVKAAGDRAVLLTASPERLYNAVLSRYHAMKYLDDAWCTDDLRLPKSDKRVFLYVAYKMGFDPSDCIVYEDSQTALLSAMDAGMRAVCVKDDFSNPTEYDSRINDFTELL